MVEMGHYGHSDQHTVCSDTFLSWAELRFSAIWATVGLGKWDNLHSPHASVSLGCPYPWQPDFLLVLTHCIPRTPHKTWRFRIQELIVHLLPNISHTLTGATVMIQSMLFTLSFSGFNVAHQYMSCISTLAFMFFAYAQLGSGLGFVLLVN